MDTGFIVVTKASGEEVLRLEVGGTSARRNEVAKTVMKLMPNDDRRDHTVYVEEGPMTKANELATADEPVTHANAWKGEVARVFIRAYDPAQGIDTGELVLEGILLDIDLLGVTVNVLPDDGQVRPAKSVFIPMNRILRIEEAPT